VSFEKKVSTNYVIEQVYEIIDINGEGSSDILNLDKHDNIVIENIGDHEFQKLAGSLLLIFGKFHTFIFWTRQLPSCKWMDRGLV